MMGWNILCVLLMWHCCDVNSKPAFLEPSSTTKATTEDEPKDYDEVKIPDNMNIADYYFSIFGKHLDYDYREPLLSFDEPVKNELSEETDTKKDPEIQSRKKRFAFLPASFYNSTRRLVQQNMMLRQERRRLRLQRRQQWQLNRIKYLNARSDSLQRQAVVLRQQLERQKYYSPVFTRSTTPLSPSTSSASNNVPAASNIIPVKQAPLPSNSKST